MIEKAAKLINNDALWNKTQEYYNARFSADMKQFVQDREYYRRLVNKVVDGFVNNPPKFLPANEFLPSEGGGKAYAGKGGPIYIREAFFKELSPKEQRTVIVHEYGRIYLWDELPNDNSRSSDKRDILNWDSIILQLNMDYEKIIK